MEKLNISLANVNEITAGMGYKVHGPGSSVGIATDCGLDGLGIESR